MTKKNDQKPKKNPTTRVKEKMEKNDKPPTKKHTNKKQT